MGRYSEELELILVSNPLILCVSLSHTTSLLLICLLIARAKICAHVHVCFIHLFQVNFLFFVPCTYLWWQFGSRVFLPNLHQLVMENVFQMYIAKDYKAMLSYTSYNTDCSMMWFCVWIFRCCKPSICIESLGAWWCWQNFYAYFEIMGCLLCEQVLTIFCCVI